MVIQVVLLLTAVQAQPLVVVTVAADAAGSDTLCAVGATVKLHTPACVTFSKSARRSSACRGVS